ncbi:ATP-binding protein, partial [Enterococcus faecium]|uniref:ATP-binding protein n=1 Tax=Enterococcus faecium TaxID=1352 RepID=UPI0031CD2DE9
DFEVEASKKKIQILVQAKVDSLIMDGDKEKLVRVLYHLLSNALKYGQGATKMVIEVERMRSEVVATVKNNGGMIPQQAIDNLIDRFYGVEE